MHQCQMLVFSFKPAAVVTWRQLLVTSRGGSCQTYQAKVRANQPACNEEDAYTRRMAHIWKANQIIML